MSTTFQTQLKSHEINPLSLSDTIKKITARIINQGDKPYASVEQQLKILTQLSEFDFGRFLLQNQGINGYWTHYMLTHPWFGRKTGKNNRGEAFTALEDFILNQSPVLLATQGRFEIFLRENQHQVKDQAKLACIPCGMMGELLYLNFNGINQIELIGIDFDSMALQDAQTLATKQHLTQFVSFVQKDAWSLQYNNEFDLISSNGLNIYEPSDEKVTELYAQFFQALKPGGKLVTSFITYPPSLTDQCEWDLSKINPEHLLLQKIIFVDIVEAKFQCFRSSVQTKQQLAGVGFTEIEFIYDKAKIFPTVIATKK